MSVTIHDEESGSVTIKLSDSGRISLSDITAATIGDLETWTDPDSTTPSTETSVESQLEIPVLRPWEEKSHLNRTTPDEDHSKQPDNSAHSESVQSSTVSNSNDHLKRQLEDFYSIADGPQWKRQKHTGGGVSLTAHYQSQNTFTNTISNLQQIQRRGNTQHNVTNRVSSPQHIQRQGNFTNSVMNNNPASFNIPRLENATNSALNNSVSDPQNLPQGMHGVTNNISDLCHIQRLGPATYSPSVQETKVRDNYQYPSLSQLCDSLDSNDSSNTWSKCDTRTVKNSVSSYSRPVSAFNSPQSKFDSPVTAFNNPVSVYNNPVSAYNSPVSAYNSPGPKNNSPVPAYKIPMSAFNNPVSAYNTPVAAYNSPGQTNNTPVSAYNQYSSTQQDNSSFGNISNFYKDHFKVKDTPPELQRNLPVDFIKNEPVTPVAKRPPPLLLSNTTYDSPGVESRFNESLSNLIGSPPPDSPLSKNPFFSDLQALLSTECKAELLPKTLFGIHESAPKPTEEENIFLRERKLHDRFNNLQASHPDEVRNLSSFFRYQTAMIETERFRTLHESQYPREHKTSVNRFYDNKIHKVISRVEQSVILLENANKENESQKSIIKPRPHLNREAIQLMENWYATNKEHPYPTNTTVEVLANNGNISADQVKKWFANKRNRSQNTRTLTEIAMKKRKLGHLVGSS